MKPVSEMTNDELDEALAREVRGWGRDTNGAWWYMEVDKFSGYYWKWKANNIFPMWRPTSNQNQAIECAESMAYITMCRVGFDANWHVTIDKNSDSKFCGAFNTSLPRAICEAVLTAARGDEK